MAGDGWTRRSWRALPTLMILWEKYTALLSVLTPTTKGHVLQRWRVFKAVTYFSSFIDCKRSMRISFSRLSASETSSSSFSESSSELLLSFPLTCGLLLCKAVLWIGHKKLPKSWLSASSKVEDKWVGQMKGSWNWRAVSYSYKCFKR